MGNTCLNVELSPAIFLKRHQLVTSEVIMMSGWEVYTQVSQQCFGAVSHFSTRTQQAINTFARKRAGAQRVSFSTQRVISQGSAGSQRRGHRVTCQGSRGHGCADTSVRTPLCIWRARGFICRRHVVLFLAAREKGTPGAPAFHAAIEPCDLLTPSTLCAFKAITFFTSFARILQ